ncbi:LexA family protein, partial [Clostridioides difficile]
ALINGESATVKRFFKEGNLIRLQPENDFMEPIMLNDSEVEIVGIVTGVFRVIK